VGWESVERYCAAGSGLPGREVVGEVLDRCSTLGSGTRTLAIFSQRYREPTGPLCIYLDEVKDPGNIGTILRSALAFGASSVVLSPGCADPFGPKAVRASMGAIFEVPVAKLSERDNLAALPGEKIALIARQGDSLRGPATKDMTLVIGSERSGLEAEVVEGCDRIAHIPIHSESLNVAMAVTVALYELTR
jgi:TrmH family RNA methyltransferase